jgi:uncharacterized protein
VRRRAPDPSALHCSLDASKLPIDPLAAYTGDYRTGTNKQGEVMAISKELLDILACPKCKGDVQLNQDGDGLVCSACRLVYPIKDDIPVMLIEEAARL